MGQLDFANIASVQANHAVTTIMKIKS